VLWGCWLVNHHVSSACIILIIVIFVTIAVVDGIVRVITPLHLLQVWLLLTTRLPPTPPLLLLLWRCWLGILLQPGLLLHPHLRLCRHLQGLPAAEADQTALTAGEFCGANSAVALHLGCQKPQAVCSHRPCLKQHWDL
jgi:hypothetical protein